MFINHYNNDFMDCDNIRFDYLLYITRNLFRIYDKTILEYEILDAYNATYKDFKDQCDNNDGFMIMDVEYNNQSDLDKDSFGSQNNLEKIRFGFILSDDGNPTKPVTLEEYAKLPINNLSDKFINSYKGLLQSLDIGFLSIDEVKSKLEL